MSDLPSAKRQCRVEARDNNNIAGASDNNYCPKPTISTLPNAVLNEVFSFVGGGNYRYVAGTNRHFRRVYESNQDCSKDTFWSAAAASVPCAELLLEDYKLLEKEEELVKDALIVIVKHAIKDEHVDVLEWAQQHGFNSSWFLGPKEFYLLGLCGRVTVLDWLNATPTKWDYHSLLDGAAFAGNVNVLEWLRGAGKHQFVLDKITLQELVWYQAGKSGNVSVLQWMLDNNLVPPIYWKAWDNAAVEGHVNVLDWLEQNDPRHREFHLGVVFGAISGGQTHVLEWAKVRGYTFSERDCGLAASCGHLAALQWLCANDCPWDGKTIRYAREEGYSHIVEWARENGCPEPELESESDDDY